MEGQSRARVEEKAAQVFVSAYRGFALVVATFQIFFVSYFRVYAWQNWLLFGVVTAFTLFKTLRSFRPYSKKFFTYADFTLDLALSTSLPLFTGGLHSPFLLYCLCPILSSALFFPRKLTLSILAVPLASLVIGQLMLRPTSQIAISYPLELAIALLSAVIVAAILIAWLPYMMNINTSQAIKRQAVMNERKRLSHEMHDGVAQSLQILRWKIDLLQQMLATGRASQALPQVSEIRGMVEGVQQELRATIDELRIGIEGKQGFVTTLAQYATEFTQSYGIRCEMHLADGRTNLPLTTELELLRIAREALSNVRRHSTASTVEVTFESKQDSIEMTIRDNGLGFDPKSSFQGHGLTVMAERARSVGGELSITTTPGHGTEVKVKLPVAETQRPAVARQIKEALRALGGRTGDDQGVGS